MAPRPLTSPPKTTTQRKHRDTAVAWVTSQQPAGQFVGSNVTADIHKALKEGGYKTSQEAISYAMVALERDGFAAREVIGRRVTVFMVDPDVVVPVPGFVAARRARDAGRASSNGTAAPAPPATRRPPVPVLASSRPPWLDALADGLTTWWREDPADADAWAAEVFRSIGVQL